MSSTTSVTEYFIPTNAIIKKWILDHAPGESHPAACADLEIHGELVRTKNAKEDVIVYLLHGGAYVFGSDKMYRFMSDRIGGYAQALVFAIDYRLAPEFPFPCALIGTLTFH